MFEEIAYMKLDRKVAFLGLLLGVGLLVGSARLLAGLGLGATITISCLTYLAITSRKNRARRDRLSFNSNNKMPYSILVAVAGATIIFCLWSLSSFQYSRPFAFFVFASIISAVISFEIGLLKPHGNRFRIVLILVQILVLVISLSWSTLLAAPSLVGVDSNSDSFGVNYILKTGHVITSNDLTLNYVHITGFEAYWSQGQYSLRPLMQIFVSEMQLLTNFQSLKLAFALSVGLSEIVSILFTFILVQRLLHDERLAAIATLLVGVSTWHIVWGTMIYPMTMGIVLFSLLLSLLPLLWSSGLHGFDRRVFVLVLIVLTALFFTHTLSSLLGLILICFAWLSERMFRNGKGSWSRLSRRRALTILLLVAIVMLSAQWVFSGFVDNMIPSVIESTTGTPMTVVYRNQTQFEIDNFGLYCLYFLAILGFLGLLRRLDIRRASFGIRFVLISAAGFFFLTYAVGVLGAAVILPERWLVFMLIVIVPVAVVGYQLLGSLLNNYKRVILALFVFVLTFAMIISSSANLDTPFYFSSSSISRKTVRSSEIAAASLAISDSSNTVYVDAKDTMFYSYVFWSHLWSNKGETEQLDFGTLTLRANYGLHGLIIVRNNGFYQPVPLSDQLEEINQIYSNGGAEIFSIPTK